MSYRDLAAIAGLPDLLVATVLSRLAARMFSLVLVLFALARFGSPALAGWLIFAAVAPGLAVSPLAGALLDRIGPARAIATDMAASAGLLVVLVGASLLGRDSVPVLFGLVVVFSLTSPLGGAGIRVLLPRLVPAAVLDRVNGVDTAIWAVVDVLGPGIAGALAGFAGPRWALAAVAATYALAASCMLRMSRLPDRLPAAAAGAGVPPQTGFLRQTLEGIVAVARQPTLRGLALSYSLYQVAWGVLVVVVPVVAARHFAGPDGSTVAGLLWATMGVAGGVGALAAGHLRTTGRERRVMACGMIVTALAAWPVAAAFGIGGLVAGLLMVGVVAGPIDVSLLTLRQRRTDPRQLGRVLSISMSLNVVGFPIGSALAGMLTGRSLDAAFLLAAAAAGLAAIATMAIPGEG